MFFETRRWCITSVASVEDLAEKLTQHTWCCCNGFALGGYWFLNDSTGPDRAQEYAVVKIAGPSGKPMQVESLTISWCTYDQVLDYIRRSIAGEYDRASFVRVVDPCIETHEQHGRCQHCA